MGKLITNILLRMELSGLINKEDEEVYQFGLECLFLKIIHYSSYLFIGHILHMTITLLVSGVAFMPLRSKAGGYHAKTRIGCYLFSCVVVALVCMLNKFEYSKWVAISVLCIINGIIYLFAPVENSNRILLLEEKQEFRCQALIFLIITDAIIALAILKGWHIYQWLLNGLLAAACLILIGKVECLEKHIKENEKGEQ